jgi:hypothetical protein
MLGQAIEHTFLQADAQSLALAEGGKPVAVLRHGMLDFM